MDRATEIVTIYRKVHSERTRRGEKPPAPLVFGAQKLETAEGGYELGKQFAVKNFLPHTIRSIAKILLAMCWRKIGTERRSYPALFEMDRYLIQILPQTGTYLEIGANDGYSQSNTYALEVIRGWSGVLIEPSRRLARLCRWHRKALVVNAACGRSGEYGEVSFRDDNLMSKRQGAQRSSLRPRKNFKRSHEFRAEILPISDILRASGYERVTFMSIDVEGAELDVLDGLDLANHAPEFLLIETAFPEKVDQVLRNWMTRACQLSFHDYLYIRTGGQLST